jgi:hypothetical protein
LLNVFEKCLFMAPFSNEQQCPMYFPVFHGHDQKTGTAPYAPAMYLA